MSDDDLAARLRRLGLRVRRDALTAFLEHVHKSRLGPTETIEQLVDLEDRARAAVNLARRTRFACLGSFKTIDRFDWAHPEKIDRSLVERLAELDFVAQAENVLLKGGSGLGKTMIAQNLANAALAAGYTVRFSTLASALADLLNQESMPAFERRLRRYTRPDLLVLDELGYLPCDTRAADILYNIINRRHEQRSTIITTNQTRYAPGREKLDADPGARYWGAGTVEARTLGQRTRWPRGGCCCFTHTAADGPWFIQHRRLLRSGRSCPRSCKRS